MSDARSEHGVGHQAFQSGLAGIGRLRRGNTEPERWLHDEERHKRGHQAKRQGRQQGWALSPTRWTPETRTLSRTRDQ